jgi:hypothetical protein
MIEAIGLETDEKSLTIGVPLCRRYGDISSNCLCFRSQGRNGYKWVQEERAIPQPPLIASFFLDHDEFLTAVAFWIELTVSSAASGEI